MAYGRSIKEVGGLLCHIWEEQNPSEDSGDEGTGKGSERGSYLPKVTQPERPSKAIACDLFTSDSSHLLVTHCGQMLI